MSTIASLRILLGLDAGDVSKGAGRVRGELRGVQVEANRSRDALRGVAAGFGLGAGLGTFAIATRVVGEFTDFLGNAVEGAIEEEAGIKRLGQALQANVADWHGNTVAIERTIEARTALGFKDDELRASFGSLVTATKDINAAFAIQSTAIDLARFKSISLEDATARLIKVNAGSFRALKDLGIELKAGASGMQALAEVQKRVAGQGEGFLDTTAGSLARAEAAVDKLSDAIGQRLAPSIAGGADALTDFINQDLPSFAENSQREIDELTGFFQDLIGAARDLASINDDVVVSAADVAAAAERAGAETAAWTVREREGADAAVALAAAVDESQDALLEQVQKSLDAKVATAELKKWMDLAGDSSAGLNNDLLTAANGMTAFAADTRTATKALQDFETANGDAHASAANRDQDFDTTHPGGSPAGAHPAAAKAERDRVVTENRRIAAQVAADSRQHANDAKRTAEEAARQAERDTADAKRAQQEAWRDAQDAADQYFDRVHEGNRRAIDDIRDRRNAELDAANAAIQGAVDAEREKLNAIRDREREQELRGAVSAAESPEDLVSAQRNLQRFLQDQRIDFLQGRADAEIALNEAARENANAAADMAIAAEALRDIAARERFDPRVRTNADGTVASVNLADFENDAPIVIQLYVDGEQITEVVDRRLNGRRSARTPTSASTGSMQ